MKRLLRSLLGLVLLLLFLSVLLVGLSFSQTGSRGLLAMVPGLQVTGFNGQLANSWRAEKIDWAKQIQLSELSFAWQPSCLLKAKLCIDSLKIAQLQIQLEESAEQSTEPFTGLPDVQLPLSIDIAELKLGQLLVAGQDFQQIELNASTDGQQLLLKHLNVLYAGMGLSGSGQLEMRQEWPLTADLQLEMPLQDQQPWQLLLAAKGGLNKRLAVQVHSEGYLNAELAGWVEPLKANVPASLELSSERFLALADLPHNLTLEQLELQAAGDLAAGYQLKGTSQLAGQKSPLPLSLLARVTAQGVLIEELLIKAEQEQQLSLQAELNWQDELEAKVKARAQHFPWQALYPAEVDLHLEGLDADLFYGKQSYHGTLDLQMRSPLGKVDFKTDLTGDQQQLQLPNLRLSAGQGSAEGKLELAFAQALGWNAQLQLKGLNPAFWLPELPGQLNGSIESQGSHQEGVLQWQAQSHISGKLRQQDAKINLNAHGKAESIQIPSALLQVGSNSISANLSLDQQLSAQAKIQMPRLAQLWPGLNGQLQGTLNASGSLAQPELGVQLNAEQVSFAEARFSRLNLKASLNRQGHGSLLLTAEQLAQGELDLGQLNLNANGTAEQHKAALQMTGEDVSADIALSGGMKNGDWRGQVGVLKLGWQDLAWQLRKSTAVQYLADGRLLVGSHCWEQLESPATLCAGEQQLAPTLALDYQLSRFELETLAPLISPELHWQGELNGRVQMKLPEQGPQGVVHLEAGSGVLATGDDDDRHELHYQSFLLHSQLAPRQIDSRLQLVGTELGQLDVHLKFDPRQRDPSLNGSYQLQQLQLALAKPFLPMLDELSGRLDGQGQIHGSLMHPQIFGGLQLQQGEISGVSLPVSFEQLQLGVQFTGHGLSLSGNWKNGEDGTGQLQGQANWEEQFNAELTLKADDVPVTLEPYARLEADADLKATWQADGLNVTGVVKIPVGVIEVREIPEGTVQVSDDTYIVGADEDDSVPIKIGMNVQVLVGEERLAFSGFGLSANIKGNLRIVDDLDTRGELSLLDGLFKAYGQRLTIRKARIFFVGSLTRPYLDVEAVRTVNEVVAGLRLSGPLDEPKTTVFSEPAMSQEQALSYLVLGRPLGHSEDNNMLAQAALALGLAGSQNITSGIARLFGVQDFEVDTQGSGLTTSVVASGRLSERLSLRYGVGVFEPTTILALRYELTRRLYLEAASGLVSSLDLFYRRDF